MSDKQYELLAQFINASNIAVRRAYQDKTRSMHRVGWRLEWQKRDSQ